MKTRTYICRSSGDSYYLKSGVNLTAIRADIPQRDHARAIDCDAQTSALLTRDSSSELGQFLLYVAYSARPKTLGEFKSAASRLFILSAQACDASADGVISGCEHEWYEHDTGYVFCKKCNQPDVVSELACAIITERHKRDDPDDEEAYHSRRADLHIAHTQSLFNGAMAIANRAQKLSES